MGAFIGLVILLIVGLVVGSVVLSLVAGLVGWLIVGLLAGLIASYLVKDRTGRGLLNNAILGVFGSLLSGFLLHLVGLGNLNDRFLGNLFFSTLGALLIIWLGRQFANRNRASYRINNRY